MIRLETDGFIRGSTLFANEKPTCRIKLSPYLIDRLPVTGVSWWEAMAFARFEGKSLPSGAQHANFAPGCEPIELDCRATGVEELPFNTSASGCRDMAGNIGEWCLYNASKDRSDLTMKNYGTCYSYSYITNL